MATGYNNYFNPNTTPIAEITYDLPSEGSFKILDYLANPIITIKYADGTQNVFDTNLIFKRGMELGKQRANDAIKRKLGI